MAKRRPFQALASNRRIRGGSWNNNANNCAVSNRNNNPDNRNNNNGLRLARSSGTVVDATRASRTGGDPVPAGSMNRRDKIQQTPARVSRPRGFRFERPGGGNFSGFPRLVRVLILCAFSLPVAAQAILAGGEFDLPEDRPSWRVDGMGAVSPFTFVGALEMTLDGRRFLGTGTALSPHWVLTAGHNVDFNDDGAPDAGLAVSFHLPGFGVFDAASFTTHPAFTGFGNPSIHHDLALLHFADPLPPGLVFPTLGLAVGIGDAVTLAGFGRSGYGSYGYTTAAGLANRRTGQNTIESFTFGGGASPELFRYTFHPPDDPRSLGNEIETIIGPGDSGGPALLEWNGGHALVGINTFTEGYGGRFGDIGGGIVLEPYWEWIAGTTGLALIPEPATAGLAAGLVLLVFALWVRHRRPASR